jgi:cytochrome c oxidase subunit 4
MNERQTMSNRVVPVSTYVAVFVALLILTGTTCWISYLNLGRFNALVAVTIAVAKATLVALFFMHLRYSIRLAPFVAVASLFWLGIMLALTLSDYLTRTWVARTF